MGEALPPFTDEAGGEDEHLPRGRLGPAAEPPTGLVKLVK